MSNYSEDGREVAEILSRDEIHQIAFELGGTNDGEYLLTADDLDALVARLNRRAIPAGLLGRIVNRDHMHTTEWWGDVTELRTLLSRD